MSVGYVDVLYEDAVVIAVIVVVVVGLVRLVAVVAMAVEEVDLVWFSIAEVSLDEVLYL